LAIEADAIAFRIGPIPKARRCSIHLNPAGAQQIFGAAPGAEACRGQDFLQPFGGHGGGYACWPFANSAEAGFPARAAQKG
jgi:hypothetical protein